MIKGQVISGRFGEILVRQKSDQEIELGELLIAKNKAGKILLQVYDLEYGSQISPQNLELISGMKLEEDADMEFMDPHLRNYTLARLKNLILIKDKENKSKAISSKSLPAFFSELKEVTAEDLKFLGKPQNSISMGYLRSGTKKLDVPVHLDGLKVFSHHILISGTTGKGKSVLMSNLLWDSMDKDYCALLVLDPHDEYYGRNKIGLKDHPNAKLIYYTSKNAPSGQRTLKINLKSLRPDHFDFMNFSGPQGQLMYTYYKKFKQDWVENLLIEGTESEIIKEEFHEMSLAVVRRQFKLLLDLDVKDKQLFCNGVFDQKAGEATISDIAKELEEGNTVVVDTSNFSGQVELLIGSLITTEVFRRYKNYKVKGELKDKPVISIVLEEAPRVLGKQVLEKGSNIFSTIAREGRKFKVGLTAITQLPSLIPREILANMNTKIILGTEMNSERQAIIESASQDLSNDNRSIASLDVGEAIVTSNFARFALPISIPYFDEEAKKQIEAKKTVKKEYSGVELS
ncbi:MAG: ATP-binding protein [archaeon]